MAALFRWIRRLLILALLAVVVWLFRGYPLRAIGSFLVVQEEPRQAQAIVVLAGDQPARILGAFDLYKQGFSHTILLSPGHRTAAEEMARRRGLPFFNEAEQNRRLLIQMGVPEERIVTLDGDVGSTFDEAVAVKAYFEGRSVRTILLVTSRNHSRRARLAFNHILRQSMDVVSTPTLYDEFEARQWWHYRHSAREVLFEYQKLLAYWAVTFQAFLGEVGSFPEKVREGKAI